VELTFDLLAKSCPPEALFGVIHTHPAATSDPSPGDLIYALLLHKTTKAPLTGIIGYDTTVTFFWVEEVPPPRRLKRWSDMIEKYGILPLADLEEVTKFFTIVKMKARFRPPPPPERPRLRDILREEGT